jgi:integrase
MGISRMGRRRQGELPRYRLHKQSGQAVVSLPLGGGKYRDLLLGCHGSEESQREYERVINEWLASGRNAPLKSSGPAPDLTVAELCLRFWKHAEGLYRLADGSPSRELDHYKYAQKALIALYGHKPASEFGPLGLKAVRQSMIDARQYRVRFDLDARPAGRWLPDEKVRLAVSGEGRGDAMREDTWSPVEVLETRKALSRRVVNQRIDHIRRMFKWAVSEELAPPSVYEALKAVAGLRRGHEGTKEKPKIKPVSDEHVEATLHHLNPQVAAMVRLQRLIGARATEVCLMRGRDIDRSGPVWWYRIDPNEIPREGPANLHKTAHHQQEDGSATVKALPLGPKAQVALAPWLRDNPEEFLFQPKEARRAQDAEKRKNRKSPMTPSQLARKPKADPKRAPQDHYTHHSYRRAIARACEQAKVPCWMPHQLKHACGTQVRKRFGAEASRIFLGHSKLSTTEIYAEADMNQVEKIALEMG